MGILRCSEQCESGRESGGSMSKSPVAQGTDANVGATAVVLLGGGVKTFHGGGKIWKSWNGVQQTGDA